MNAQLALARDAFRRLHAECGRKAHQHGVRWIHWAAPRTGSDAWLRVGLDPDATDRNWLRNVMSAGGESVPWQWVAAEPCGETQSEVTARNGDNDSGVGTIGALVRERVSQKTMALTAGHVVAGATLARAQDPVSLSVGATLIGQGRLHDWAPSFATTQTEAAIDAGLVRLDDALEHSLSRALFLPVGSREPHMGESLRLHARGLELLARACGYLTTFMRVGSDGFVSYRLEQGLCYDVFQMPRAGDSGGGVFTDDGQLVAIHTGSAPAGSVGNAVATPIGRVLNYFGVDLVLANRPARSAAPGPALVEVPAPASAAIPSSQRSSEIDVLARTMWGEARGEGPAGMAAVAHVVLNRRDAQRWWGRGVEAVCHKPFQFSCWNAKDPNLPQMLALRPGNAVFDAATRMASELLAMPATQRVRDDPTNGATHYHARSLRPIPAWARQQSPCATAGRHVFYRGIA